jgi:hypothetical protein
MHTVFKKKFPGVIPPDPRFKRKGKRGGERKGKREVAVGRAGEGNGRKVEGEREVTLRVYTHKMNVALRLPHHLSS